MKLIFVLAVIFFITAISSASFDELSLPNNFILERRGKDTKDTRDKIKPKADQLPRETLPESIRREHINYLKEVCVK
jgi:hypothetical protein